MLNPGDVIGGCRILAKLGGGGMGTVYRAEQLSLGRLVALKVMNQAMQDDVECGERFLREARTAAAVSHANTVAIYDVGRDNGRLYLVQELVTGGSAKDLLTGSGGILNERRAMEVIADCCAGLQAILEAGLIHRDIKPENILITADGAAKLGDFGLARAVDAGGEMTMTGATIGTPAYMSPEQAQGRKDLDIRSDIFSLGATLYCLVTGGAPYKADSAFAMVAKMLTEPVPDPRAIRPDLSDGIVAVILRAMAKDPAERYPTPRLMRQVLENLVRRRSGSSADTVPTTHLGRGGRVKGETTHGTVTPEAKTAKTAKLPPAEERLVSQAATAPIERKRATGQGSRAAAVSPALEARNANQAGTRAARSASARPSPSPLLLIIAAGLAALVGAVVAVLLLRSTPPPATPTTTPAPPASPAVEAQQPPAAVAATPPVVSTAPVELVRRGSDWRYHDGGTDLGSDWRTLGFVDSGWKHGPAPLGFGDPWIRTQVDSGSDKTKRHRTTYFRLHVSAPADRRFTSLDLSLMRDDGAVIYLNGREVARSNMDQGTVTYATEARTVVGGDDEQRFIDIALDPADLHPGDNVLAVEIHQKGNASTDLGFDLGLVGK